MDDVHCSTADSERKRQRSLNVVKLSTAGNVAQVHPLVHQMSSLVYANNATPRVCYGGIYIVFYTVQLQLLDNDRCHVPLLDLRR
jgi:hypothetical protein